ncbi:MAG: heat-inducible transcriptional repressor HrcA [Eubacteriales bacterium]|nr:heat-inducible transcriptional repressor HrcA [Eubacteriales bacterium]MDD3349272.1 heat-inducible transcriptional repressor HrcA [Eubacteriales bacterium]
MDLNERKLKILHAIVSDFIHSAEPIGSRTLSRKYSMGISPATIRNEMSDLEEMGFLTHPYTSAGRVPSSKAYRLYVNDLMKRYELSDGEKKTIEDKLTNGLAEFDRTIEHAAKLLSEMTNLISFAITPKQEEDKLKYINLIPVDENTVVLMIVAESGKVSNTALKLKVPYNEERLSFLAKVMTYNYRGKTISNIMTMDIIKDFESDMEALSQLAGSIMPKFMNTLEGMMDVELYLDGLTNIFAIPEYNDIERAKLILEMFNRKQAFTDLLINRDSGMIITIGDENSDKVLQDCSLITATYRINGKLIGKLGVIGPTRMKYDEITSVIEYMTDNLSTAYELTGGEEDE